MHTPFEPLPERSVGCAFGIKVGLYFQKKFTVDFPEKKMKSNEGEVLQYYVESSHPAIMEPDEWDDIIRTVMMEKAIVHKDDGVTLVFKNGTEIRVGL